MSTTLPRSKPRSRKQKAIALQAQRRRSTRLFAAGTAGLVVLLLIAVFVTRGGSDGKTSGAETRAVTVTGEALPAFSDADDPAIGRSIPEARGESFDGTSVEISADGTPKMLLFLAHWCPHCQAEVPVIQAWIDEQGLPEGIDVISVATATDRVQPNYPPSKWLEKEGWTVPVLVDDAGSTVGESFGVSSYPFFVFVDADGKVSRRAAGELPIEQIESMLATIKD